MRRWVRPVAVALALLLASGGVAGCQSRFAGLRLTLATGDTDGVYYQVGSQLAGIWSGQLGIPRPKVLRTEGSVDNLQRLRDGKVDIGFGSADAVTYPDQGERKLRALGRLYDDYIQVVVPANGPIQSMGDLTGKRVAIGPVKSQVHLVAGRMLAAAGVTGAQGLPLDLNSSISALRAGRIDAFFWSGGLPTDSITKLSASVPVRLLDLADDPSDVLHTMVSKYPVYGAGLVPAGTYGLSNPSVTTLTVPNFLLVTDRMSNDVAQALVAALFGATRKLVGVNSAALGIDVHSAIYTQPVPLHPGAQAYYRSAKI
jgi:TRAP transporter TAXI family solute receptor